MSKFCIYQIGYGVIHAIGETEEQCRENYLTETGEEFNGSDNFYQCEIGDTVLIQCEDKIYNKVLTDGGQFRRGELVVCDGCLYDFF